MHRLRRLPAALLLGGLLLATAAQPARAASTGNDLDIMTYYQAPRPERLPDFLYATSLRKDAEEGSIDLYAVFLAAALDRSPDKGRAALAKAAALPPDRSELALKTAWLMRGPLGRDFLQQAAGRDWPDAADMLRTPAPDFRTVEPLDPFYLDCLWATFFATGEDWPVRRVVSVLENKPGTVDEGVLLHAASWSLESNAKSHPRVLAILTAARRTAAPGLAERLDEILNAK